MMVQVCDAQQHTTSSYATSPAALQVLQSPAYQQWLQSLGASYQHLLLPPGVAVTPTLAGAAKLQVRATVTEA